ncbi:MAG TPA: GAF domain-containing protein [Myxococcales bacterium]|jgi:signal transduction histidine kinase
MTRISGRFPALTTTDPKELLLSLNSTRERFSSVLGICRAIGSTLDLDQVLNEVIARTSKSVRAERSTLFLVDNDKAEIWSKVVQGEGLSEIRLPLGSGIAGWVCRNGHSVLLNDAKSDERFNRMVDRVTGYKTRSMVVSPIHDKSGTVLGAIQALNRIDGDFTQEDVAVLEAISAQAGVAIENARLYRDVVAQNAALQAAKEALAGRVSELDLLFDIEQRISSATSLEDLVDGILATAMDVLEVEAGSILTLEEDLGALFFKSAQGPKGEQVKKFKLQLGEGIAGEVASTGKPVMTNDAASHPAYAPRIAKSVNLPTRAVVCVPLVGEKELIGALELINPAKGRKFEEHDLRLATLIAGQVSRAIAVARERVEGERKARLAAIGQMIAGMLHDLRTPMTLVSGYAQMMVDDEQRESRENSSEIILKQLDHISAMAKETLAFARGETDILLRKVYLNKFVEEISEFLAKDLEGKEIELEMVGNFLGTVRMDEGKIKRAIYNIARNAAQAMPRGGTFTVTVDKEEDKVVFRLADTGPGIPDEIADKIFQSFVTSGKKDGTGLGLAIVKKVIEQHGGDVSFKSKPGKGTTFLLRIPG